MAKQFNRDYIEDLLINENLKLKMTTEAVKAKANSVTKHLKADLESELDLNRRHTGTLDDAVQEILILKNAIAWLIENTKLNDVTDANLAERDHIEKLITKRLLEEEPEKEEDADDGQANTRTSV